MIQVAVIQQRVAAAVCPISRSEWFIPGKVWNDGEYIARRDRKEFSVDEVEHTPDLISSHLHLEPLSAIQDSREDRHGICEPSQIPLHKAGFLDEDMMR